MQVFAGMDLKAEVDAVLIEDIENRLPALREFCECGFDEAVRPLWPRIDVGPCQRAGECRMFGETQVL